jgi:hypothetical protein
VRGQGHARATFSGWLALFTYSVGLQLTRLEAGHGPNHALLGWPLVLVLLGLVALLAPLIPLRRRS